MTPASRISDAIPHPVTAVRWLTGLAAASLATLVVLAPQARAEDLKPAPALHQSGPEAEAQFVKVSGRGGHGFHGSRGFHGGGFHGGRGFHGGGYYGGGFRGGRGFRGGGFHGGGFHGGHGFHGGGFHGGGFHGGHGFHGGGFHGGRGHHY